MNGIARRIILVLICLLSVSAGLAQKDPVVTLRNQIEVSATPEERVRLQLKLADELISAGHQSDRKSVV